MGKQEVTKFHDHDFYELVVVFKGEGLHYTGDEKYEITAGDVFLIKPEIKHGYANTRELGLINILYLPDKLQMPLYDLINSPGYHAFFEVEPAMRRQHAFKSRLRLSSTKLDFLLQLIKQLEKEIDTGRQESLFMAVSYFMQIIGFIARSYTKSQVPEHVNILALGELISYIEGNYKKHISVPQLAKRAAMSEVSLYRMFKKAFDISPVNYIISVRLSAAREMLEKGEMTVSEIAFETGFSDSNYFSRAYKKKYGLSPRYYRQRRG